MLTRTYKIILLLVFVLVFDLTASTDMQSTSYLINAFVLWGGSTAMDSTKYQMTATIGQSSAIGMSLKRSYILYSGFCQP